MSRWQVEKQANQDGICRPFRGAAYDLRIRNPGGVQSGVKQVTLDGKTHLVEVLMG